MPAEFIEAIKRGDQEAVDAALANDPGLLAASTSDGRSAVLTAAYNNQPRLAEHLAELVEKEPGGLTLFEAAAVGDVAALRRHLDGEAELEDASDDGYTALHFAAFFGRLEVARMLLERGADRNPVAQNKSRVTPLHSSVAGRHRDLVGLLLAHGASANAVQQGGFTPLHSAARNGDETIVAMLILRGADPTRPADDGRTPVDMAVEADHGALAELLRDFVRP
jgi:ankyrin repeat protein